MGSWQLLFIKRHRNSTANTTAHKCPKSILEDTDFMADETSLSQIFNTQQPCIEECIQTKLDARTRPRTHYGFWMIEKKTMKLDSYQSNPSLRKIKGSTDQKWLDEQCHHTSRNQLIQTPKSNFYMLLCFLVCPSIFVVHSSYIIIIIVLVKKCSSSYMTGIVQIFTPIGLHHWSSW